MPHTEVEKKVEEKVKETVDLVLFAFFFNSCHYQLSHLTQKHLAELIQPSEINALSFLIANSYISQNCNTLNDKIAQGGKYLHELAIGSHEPVPWSHQTKTTYAAVRERLVKLMNNDEIMNFNIQSQLPIRSIPIEGIMPVTTIP